MEFTVETKHRQQLINISPKVNEIIQQQNVKDGICHVFALHTTAAVVVHENDDPNIEKDFFKAMNHAVPRHNGYLHDQKDNNAQAHLIAAVIGPSRTLPIRKGKLVLGRWQSLMLAELDGPRTRQVCVTLLPNNKI